MNWSSDSVKPKRLECKKHYLCTPCYQVCMSDFDSPITCPICRSEKVKKAPIKRCIFVVGDKMVRCLLNTVEYSQYCYFHA